ncbi:plasmid stabilization protein [Streptomyces sp. NPDC057052]|uniref:plasmid stabilization protein n=1 Tax=Streptomyces sp. NPDC057052 TaxID=3346010 RepID=UPI00363C7694
MPRGSGPERERRYEHVEESARERGESAGRAEETAARTVNEERARSGGSKSAIRASTQDKSSGERGGQRSGKGSGGPAYDQLHEEAERRGVHGRSDMDKSRLQRAPGKD